MEKRIIKFRYWNGKEMESDFWTEYGTAPSLNQLSGMDGIMQYTGLKDKNGKEIYEGDILNVDMTESKPLEVVFHDGAFRCEESKKYLSPLSAYNTSLMVSIIGNIYENPELLNP